MNLRYCLVFFFLVLNACTGVKLREAVSGNPAAYAERAERLGRIHSWGLKGRISLDDGKEGGSGSLHWDVMPDKTELDFHGAMGRGAWHLSINPDAAVLREANGEQHTASNVDDLIQQRMGWPIPVAALQWWVRGLAAPGETDSLQLDTQGKLISLVQAGWQVNFSAYDTTTGEYLPVKLDARRDNYRVKLIVRRWFIRAGSIDVSEH